MEYNEVLEHFKKDIQNSPDIKIIQLKHGIIIFYWDEVEHSYYPIILPKNYLMLLLLMNSKGMPVKKNIKPLLQTLKTNLL